MLGGAGGCALGRRPILKSIVSLSLALRVGDQLTVAPQLARLNS